MNESAYQWSAEVASSTREAEDLEREISTLQHQLDHLVRTIQALGMVRFPDTMEDYEVLEKARGLLDLVSSGVRVLRNSIQNIANEVNDLRRAVDFYNH